MAYVELGQDNGGILLNLSEGGFAVQSAMALTSQEFPQLRFQVPAVQGWQMASGRIVWISESKKEAGIQFTELPGAARMEIHKWVSSEGSAEEIPERANGRQVRSTESREQFLAAAAGSERSPGQRAAINSAGTSNRLRVPGAAVRTAPTAVASVAPATAPAQEFRFGDYSMFAADPERDGIWIEPVKKRGHWGSLMFLGIVLSALFFVLGATVGRGTVDQWLKDVGVWKEGQAPPTTVAPPPPEATDQGSTAAVAEEHGLATDAQQASPQQPSAGAPQNIAPTASTEPSRTAQNEVKKEPDNPQIAAEARSGTEAAGVAPKRDGKGAAGLKLPDSQNGRPASAIAEGRSYGSPSAEDGRTPTGRTILVNAPEPGSPPFFVNLPNDAVSASTAIAISTQRSIVIAPRRGSDGRSERVVIGKLVSHSEPFYSREARSKGIEGSVELRLRIGRTGQVIGVTPIRGPSELMSAAVAAVREWRYEPTFLDGDPAETQADVTMVFRAR
jgi:TonB family protein